MKVFVTYVSDDHEIRVFKDKSNAIAYLEELAGWHDDDNGELEDLLDEVDALLEEHEVQE